MSTPLASLKDPSLLKTQGLINGQWVSGASHFAVHDPATGAHLVDVANLGPQEAEAAIAAAVQTFGRLDVAVNCAGVAPGERIVGRDGPHALESFARAIGINLIGTFNILRLAADAMAKNAPGEGGERGVIVNTASVAAFDGQIGQAAYAASKGGVAAMTLPNVLSRLVTEATVLMPSDRSDLLPGLILAHHSGSFPQITGVILTGGYPIPDPVVRLFDGMHLDLPIGMTELGTYTTAKQVFNTEGHFTSSPRKVEVSRRLFSERVDAQALLQALEVEPSKAITPLMFGYQLNELARRDRRRIVMPESSDDRILESASILMQRGVADLTLLGDPVEIKTRASAMGWVLDGVDIVDLTFGMTHVNQSALLSKLSSHMTGIKIRT